MIVTAHGQDWRLVRELDGSDVVLPFKTTDFRGDALTVTGGDPPHNSSSSGHIYCGQARYYAGVAGLKWEKV